MICNTCGKPMVMAIFNGSPMTWGEMSPEKYITGSVATCPHCGFMAIEEYSATRIDDIQEVANIWETKIVKKDSTR